MPSSAPTQEEIAAAFVRGEFAKGRDLAWSLASHLRQTQPASLALAQALHSFAGASLEVGEVDDACCEGITEALTICDAQAPNSPNFLAVLTSAGNVAEAIGALEPAAGLYARVLHEVAKATPVGDEETQYLESLEAKCWFGYASCMLGLGKREEAQQAIESGETIARAALDDAPERRKQVLAQFDDLRTALLGTTAALA